MAEQKRNHSGGMGVRDREQRSFARLVDVIRQVREKCPWDSKQTFSSLRPYVVEEAYEVVEAIESQEMNKLCEELGDLLLQVILQAVLAEEAGSFSLAQVMEGITAKLVRRHPHVFAGVEVAGTAEVLGNWEEIKRQERSGEGQGLLSGLPRHLPALLQADKVQRQVARVGFDWAEAAEVFPKVQEELEEVRAAYLAARRGRQTCSGSSGERIQGRAEEEAVQGQAEEVAGQGRAEAEAGQARVEEEVGDLLFSAVNLARFLGVNPEMALRHAVRRFGRRFARLEEKAMSTGKRLRDMSPSEMDCWWEEAKKEGH